MGARMTEAAIDRIWELMESVRFCMLSNWNGEHLRARPMGAFVRRSEGLVYFFTDARAHKDEDIERFPQVCLAFADPHGQKYVAVSGDAEVTVDRAKIRELWSIPARVWWESPKDPNIRLIKVKPKEAEYWDSPGNLLSSIKVAFTLATGVPTDYGEHRKVSI
jgi:general stress protein 26